MRVPDSLHLDLTSWRNARTAASNRVSGRTIAYEREHDVRARARSSTWSMARRGPLI